MAAASAALDVRTAELAEHADAIDDYSEALDRFLALGGDSFEARAAEVCDRVGLARVWDSRSHAVDDRRRGSPNRSRSLSGGEAARAALAAILLSKVDVLLLDEPTNNLDFAGLDLLEEFVDSFAGAVLVVSHDRAFLDRCVRRIVEIDEHSHHTNEFAGGWTDYVEAPRTAERQQYEAHGKYVSERDRLRTRQVRQRQWSERGVRRAKTSGETDKFIRHMKAERSEQQTSKVRATERAIERLEVVDKPWEGWQLKLQLAPNARSGQVVARFDRAVVERGESAGGFTLGPDRPRDRVAGPAGLGGSQRQRQDHAARRPAGHRPVAVRARGGSDPACRSGELDQARGLFDGDEPVVTAAQSLTGSTTARPARCSPSSISAPTTWSARPPACRPVSGAGPSWPC